MEEVLTFDAVQDEPVFTQFKHNAKGAIKALQEAGGGVAVAALYHPDIGDIDLRWGSTSDNSKNKGAGLAKLLKWHPEAINDLQGFIEKMGVDKEGPARVWLSRGEDVAILSKDWHGSTGNWLLTAYTKKKANTAGGTMDAACFASLDDTATQRSVGIEIIGFEYEEVNPTLDDTSAPDVAAMMARLKLTGELSGLKKQIDALGSGAMDMLAKLKLVARANELRKQLGDSAVPVVEPSPVSEQIPVPAPQEPQDSEPPQIKTLREVIAGTHDSKGLAELFGIIQEAVNGLEEAGLLSGDAEAAANDAITHWAELEESLSLNV